MSTYDAFERAAHALFPRRACSSCSQRAVNAGSALTATILRAASSTVCRSGTTVGLNPTVLVSRATRDAFGSRMFQIPLDEVATIGDMPNDIPMLAQAGVGIAKGNASKEVQSVARHGTTSNDDDGFANAVEQFILADRAEGGASPPQPA